MRDRRAQPFPGPKGLSFRGLGDARTYSYGVEIRPLSSPECYKRAIRVRYHKIFMLTNKIRVTVFEALNEDRKERCVGLTALAMYALIRELRDAGADEIRHWRRDERVLYRGLEFRLALAEGRALLQKAGRKRCKAGWRTIVIGKELGIDLPSPGRGRTP